MNFTSERLTDLFNLYVSKQATELEQLELWDYVDDPLYEAQLNDLLSESFAGQNDHDTLQAHQASLIVGKIFESGNTTNVIVSKVRLWPRFAVAAAAAITALVLGIFFYNAHTRQVLQQSSLANISPGRNGATLTLGNGKKIRLNDSTKGEVAKEAGLIITKDADGQLTYAAAGTQQISPSNMPTHNTLSTAKGETFSVKLPDGSLVQLNAASSITYASSLKTDDIRHVELRGEGYFEIAKIKGNPDSQKGIDKPVPFIVTSGRQQVEVLGTHFDINSYEDEKEVKTTLLEGTVRVSTTGANEKTALLKPNQQSILSLNNKLSVTTADVQNAIAWKNGFFYFSDARVEDILREFARWYDLEIEYTGAMPDRQFTGELYRNLSFAEALKILDFAKVKLNIQGKKIIVSP